MFRTVFWWLAAAVIFLAFLACDGPMPGYYTMKGSSPGEEILICGYVYYEEGVDGVGTDGNPIEIPIKILSKKPIKGIAVYVNGITEAETEGITASFAYLTDAEGAFSFYVPKQDENNIPFEAYTIIFTDIDGDKNGGQFQQFTTEIDTEEIEASSVEPLEFKLIPGDIILIRGYVHYAEEVDADGNPIKIPIKGIAVYVKGIIKDTTEGITVSYVHLADAEGAFSFYVSKQDENNNPFEAYTIIFIDNDGDANGQFQRSTHDFKLEEVEASSVTPLTIELEKLD